MSTTMLAVFKNPTQMRTALDRLKEKTEIVGEPVLCGTNTGTSYSYTDMNQKWRLSLTSYLGFSMVFGGIVGTIFGFTFGQASTASAVLGVSLAAAFCYMPIGAITFLLLGGLCDVVARGSLDDTDADEPASEFVLSAQVQSTDEQDRLAKFLAECGAVKVCRQDSATMPLRKAG